MIFSTCLSHLDSSSASFHTLGILDFLSFGRTRECPGDAALHTREKPPLCNLCFPFPSPRFPEAYHIC